MLALVSGFSEESTSCQPYRDDSRNGFKNVRRRDHVVLRNGMSIIRAAVVKWSLRLASYQHVPPPS